MELEDQEEEEEKVLSGGISVEAFLLRSNSITSVVAHGADLDDRCRWIDDKLTCPVFSILVRVANITLDNVSKRLGDNVFLNLPIFSLSMYLW